jgi:hypothetical protein
LGNITDGYMFGYTQQQFFEVVTIVNNYIQNDLVHDINVNNWNYQINKYLKISNIQKIDMKNILNDAEKYVTVNATGGLGNLLFQIFATVQFAHCKKFKPIQQEYNR